jgi:Protein of unknown function (DUF3455)
MLQKFLTTILGASAGLLLGQAALSQTPTLEQLPDALKPEGMSVYLEVPATGVQIYTCGKNAAGAWAWNFKGPEAELFDTQKRKIGKHYGGPTWELNDGSKVVAGVKANAPAPGGNAIPWLLLGIKSSEGAGEFSHAKAILRVSTTDGTAPTQGCDEANANKEARVDYTAVYLFLK